METLTHSEPISNQISTSLNQLLADEYILMNKTVQLSSMPMPTHSKETLSSFVYDDLKINVNAIAHYLKLNNLQWSISINDFLKNTRLQVQSKLTGFVNLLETIIADHYFIIARLKTVSADDKELDKELESILNDIQQRHISIANHLEEYINNIHPLNLTNYEREYN